MSIPKQLSYTEFVSASTNLLEDISPMRTNISYKASGRSRFKLCSDIIIHTNKSMVIIVTYYHPVSIEESSIERIRIPSKNIDVKDFYWSDAKLKFWIGNKLYRF